MTFDDETLMAFADGELDELTARRVDRAMAEDEAIAARVALFRASRAKVRDAMAPLANEPVPPDLQLSVAAMIERDREARQASEAASSGVVQIGEIRQARRRAPAWLMPIAAMLVLTVGGTGGYFAGSMLQPATPAEFASLDDPAIIRALSEIPSGKAMDVPGTGRQIEPVLSFRLEDGTLCREYKLRQADDKGIVSIACLEKDRWKTHLLMASTRVEEGFVPAGSAETIDAYLASIHAGVPLDGDAEDAVLKSIRR